MEYTQIQGRRVSRLIVGCEPLGGADWGKVNFDEIEQAIRLAYRSDINAFDTSNVYGLGQSETRLAEALGNDRRNAYIISKFGVNWKESTNGTRAPTFRDSSPAHARAALEASLRRLQIEAIPLYLIHWPDPKTPIEETMLALEHLHQAGKILAVGVSNFPAELIRRAHAVFPIAAVQTQYNLLAREAEHTLLPTCRELKISLLAYGPLAQGLLTGKFGLQTSFEANDRRHRLPQFQGDRLKQNLRVVERVKQVAAQRSKTPAQVALRWLLDNSVASSIIAGVKTRQQILDNLGAFGWHLSDTEMEYLNVQEDG